MHHNLDPPAPMYLSIIVILSIGVIIGIFMASYHTQRVRRQLTQHYEKQMDKLKEHAKSLEKDLKELKGDLGMK